MGDDGMDLATAEGGSRPSGRAANRSHIARATGGGDINESHAAFTTRVSDRDRPPPSLRQPVTLLRAVWPRGPIFILSARRSVSVTPGGVRHGVTRSQCVTRQSFVRCLLLLFLVELRFYAPVRPTRRRFAKVVRRARGYDCGHTAAAAAVHWLLPPRAGFDPVFPPTNPVHSSQYYQFTII